MSTFQFWWSGTRLDNAHAQHDSSSKFGMIFYNYHSDDTLINFQFRCVSAGYDKINQTDMEIFPMYEVTIKLFWYQHNPSRAKNKKSYKL